MAGFAGDNAMFPSIEEVPLIVGWHGIEGLTGTSRADPRCMCSPGGDTLLHSLVDQGADSRWEIPRDLGSGAARALGGQFQSFKGEILTILDL